MELYNALIRGEHNEIMGRINLTRQFKVPQTLKITYRGNEIHPWEINNLLCDSKDPLAITKRKSEDGSVSASDFSIFLKLPNGMMGSCCITSKTTVADLKKIICKREGIPLSKQSLLYPGTFSSLKNNEKYLISDYNIGKDHTIIVKIDILGGGGLDLLDVEGERKYGTGYVGERNWWSFSRGLNVIGICVNESCPSHLDEEKIHPIVNIGYGVYNFSENVLWCPACDDCNLKPINIKVAGGTSYISFRKLARSGEGEQKVQRTILESQGDFPNYVEISEKDSGIFEYDLIEINTVKLEESAFECCLCTEKIGMRNLEFKRECGHYFHKTCSEKHAFCPVCHATMIAESAKALCMSLFGEDFSA